MRSSARLDHSILLLDATVDIPPFCLLSLRLRIKPGWRLQRARVAQFHRAGCDRRSAIGRCDRHHHVRQRKVPQQAP